MANFYAEFEDKDAHILATLSTGDIIDTVTWVKCEGTFTKDFYRDDEGNHDIEIDIDIDEDTIKPAYPDEFEFMEDFPEGTEIVEIVKFFEEPEWKIIDETIEEYYED